MGSVVENRATVYSDIDIAIIVKDHKFKNLNTTIDIKLKAKELDLLIEAPIDIKILTKEEFESYLGTLYKKAVEVSITS